MLAHDPQAQVILYGSRARGDYKEDSDWDVLVLTSKKLKAQVQGEIIDKIYEVELKYMQAVSTLIVDKEKWDYWEIRPLNKNVAKEGIVL